ncbi:glycosyltransferase family 1 protein [Jeotgalibacillus proteolyticus]|uniref:Glycosyltransferase family 1 protein n=1 Tax=Jeotgalibacillus proteolyticus TaxID=2082395 RepID=A0A2S5G8K1_9BACL|nr:glycosyltransferase family 1 protein [Jeotgalibacillus proteolyticus]PPA69241.1 glycosyltransferase family 1 protein [Jeotgalibacillus proteolyticus]
MDGPVRVLHAVVNMNRGGAETLIMNLYRNIDRSKVQFDFLTSFEGVFDEEITSMGGRIYRIPYVTKAGHLQYLKSLEEFFKQHPYKIVHSHMDKMSGFVLRAAARAGVPSRIAHSHNTSSEGGPIIKAYKWMAGKNIPKYATQFYACSSKAAEWLFTKRSAQSLILKNGVECDRFTFSPKIREQMRKSLNLAESSFVIGHIGRFNHQKNHNFLLKVFSEFSRIHPEAHLLLAGGGALQGQIEKRIKELELTEKVHLLGIREDIPSLLQAFDAFAFPSLHEGLPVTLIEAQCSGVPCLISEAITDEVDLGCGLIEKRVITDSKSWVEALSAVKQNKRTRRTDLMKIYEKGYDIRQTAVNTQKAYIELGGISI